MKIQKPTVSSPDVPGVTSPMIHPRKPSDSGRIMNPDLLVKPGQGAQVQVPQNTHHQQGVGRPVVGGPTDPCFPVRDASLSADELVAIAKVGSAGLKGRGTVKGTIKLEKGKAFLITANKGSRSEVRFALDLATKDARGLDGKDVSVSGMIDKRSPYGGKITGAKLATAVANEAKLGERRTLTGTIEIRNPMAIGGEAAPSGSYLVLDRPLKIDGKTVKDVFVQRWPEFEAGAKLELYGRLDRETFGGVETQQGSVIKLTGVSNLGANEPKYDGKDFISSLGKPLVALRDPRPSYADAPEHLFVLDEGSDRAFLGRFGGHIHPDSNPFHGYVGVAKIEQPQASDQGKVTFDAEGRAFNKAGEELFLVSANEPAPTFPDAMTQRWFLDDASRTIYRFDSGGIAGFDNHLFAVIRLPEEV